MNISIVPFGSDQYEETKIFRERILRAPLGLKLTAEDVAGEDQQIHIAAVDESNSIVGTVLLKPLPDGIVKLRQMAVDNRLQGSGFGKKIVLFAEQVAKEQGGKNMKMHARISALGFYRKLGYSAEGDQFTENTIPHIGMTKNLF
jgi:predicted GNAT family N-acyltransferase